MQNMQRLDPLGAETAHSQDNHPTRELYYRGYYDSDHVFDLAFGYDILINVFKYTDDVDGITAVEDYYIRDLIAGAAHRSLLEMSGVLAEGTDIDTGGMWDVARRMAGVACMFAIPTYDSEYYGKSGIDGSTGGYTWAPFQSQSLSWKEVLIDNDNTMGGYPNLAKRLGIEEYNCGSDGVFQDRPVYFGHMGNDMTQAANLIRRAYPAVTFPNLEACLIEAAEGTLTGTKGTDPAQQYTISYAYNDLFPNVADVAVPLLDSATITIETSSATAPYQWGLYDEDYEVGSGPPDPPASQAKTIRNNGSGATGLMIFKL